MKYNYCVIESRKETDLVVWFDSLETAEKYIQEWLNPKYCKIRICKLIKEINNENINSM